jgi:hypothetical protein
MHFVNINANCAVTFHLTGTLYVENPNVKFSAEEVVLVKFIDNVTHIINEGMR